MTSFAAWVITVGALLACILVTLALAWITEREDA
jgi:hypothetical protein